MAVETKHIIRQDQKTIRVIKNSLGNYENYTQDEVMFYDVLLFLISERRIPAVPGGQTAAVPRFRPQIRPDQR